MKKVDTRGEARIMATIPKFADVEPQHGSGWIERGENAWPSEPGASCQCGPAVGKPCHCRGETESVFKPREEPVLTRGELDAIKSEIRELRASLAAMLPKMERLYRIAGID